MLCRLQWLDADEHERDQYEIQPSEHECDSLPAHGVSVVTRWNCRSSRWTANAREVLIADAGGRRPEEPSRRAQRIARSAARYSPKLGSYTSSATSCRRMPASV